MSTVRRNDPCPCGSGKKYKHCHWSKDQHPSNAQPTPQPIPTFEHLIENYNTDPIIKMIGILQLLPLNHGQEARFEEMARLALLQRRENDGRPFASWQRVNAVVGNIGYPEDEPTNAFTENAVFSEGNYIVYPGIYVGVTTIINELLECIFLRENKLPAAFIKDVNDGAGLLLFMSNVVAEEKGHTRYMQEASADDSKIKFPEYETFIEDAQTLTFKKEWIKKICKFHHYNYEIVQEFIISNGDPELYEADPDENPVSRKPLLETKDEIVMYMPTTVVNSILEFVYHKARQYNCYEAVLSLLCNNQFHNSCKAMAKMGWLATDIQLPESTIDLPIKEMVFQFDNQKFGYVCFIETVNERLRQFKSSNSLETRTQEVITYLQTLNEEQAFQVLTLLITAETGQDGFFAWEKPKANNQTMSFQYRELMALAYAKKTNALSLWKFAKAYTRTAEKVRIMSMGGSLDAYAIYKKNDGSLLHSDKENPIGGIMMIVNGSSNEFQREVQRRRDEHAVILFNGKIAGYTKVVKEKDFAPIYTDKFVSSEHRLVIENFKMPVWITNYQSESPNDITWANHVCEAIAFWFQKMEATLKPLFEDLTLVQFEIEIIVDEVFLRAEQFEIKEIELDKVVIDVVVDAPKIKLTIPFDFLYLVRQSNNIADKLLMKAALKGILDYTIEAGKKIKLDEEQIDRIVDEALQPVNAKMILFSDASRNVRMDDRGLPPMRYIHDADISYILDNLVSYLPDGYKIPARITSTQEKIQLCDDVVKALITQIKNRIQQFDGEMLLQWLIAANEKCTQVKEFREILIPAKIACYSTFDSEVEELTEKGESLVTTAHALRTLIEWAAIDIPNGKMWANFDDIDELLALTNQLTNWGASSEAMRFGLSDPEMGLLPSGRIGSEKTMERDILEPYATAKTKSEVFQFVEKFEKNYSPKGQTDGASPNKETIKLDEAFHAEFGLTLTQLSQIIGGLIHKGFKTGKAFVKLSEMALKEAIKKSVTDITDDDIDITLELLTLMQRPDISIPPKGYKATEIFPWRFTRSLSYIRRPLVKHTESKEVSYYYGYRHLMTYIDNLYFLLFTGKLPETNSEKMKSWIAATLSEKGKPYRNNVRDWFENHTSFEVIDYEVSIKPGGHLQADKDYGDIDVLVIDHETKIVYLVECKNSIGARNIHEMKTEMDLYLGRDGNESRAKIMKHFGRDKWLKENRTVLSKFIKNPEEYLVKSFILTADEIPLPYLKKEQLPLPIKSFVFLRKDGTEILNDL